MAVPKYLFRQYYPLIIYSASSDVNVYSLQIRLSILLLVVHSYCLLIDETKISKSLFIFTIGICSIVYFSHLFVPTPDVVPIQWWKYHVINFELRTPSKCFKWLPVIKNTVFTETIFSINVNLGSSDNSIHAICCLEKSSLKCYWNPEENPTNRW